jgi:putative ABC transport system permease protein
VWHGEKGSARNLRRAVAPGFWGLRAYRGTAVLLVSAAAMALTALLPVTSLASLGAAGLVTRLALPAWSGGDLGMTWRTIAWNPTDATSAALTTLFQLLLGVAIGVLAVAGLTMLSLSVARASARAAEMNIRRAVGASRRDLVATALVEGGALAAGALLAGGLAGAAVARSALATWPGTLRPGTAAASVMAILTALIGLPLGAALPVAFPRRTALPRPSVNPFRLVVPALQLGLSLTVLTGAALLRRQADPLTGVRPPAALRAGDVFHVTGPDLEPPRRAARYASLLRRLRAHRAFDTVSLSSPGTLVGVGVVDVVITDCGACAQGGLPYPLQPVPTTHYLVSADTFRVLGLAVLEGRGISAADRWNTSRVAVVNRSLATHHFQQGRAVGRKILIGGGAGDWYEVVGIVEDQRPAGFGAGLEPPFSVYLSVLQHPARAIDLFVGHQKELGLTTTDDDDVRGAIGSANAVHTSAARLLDDAARPARWFARRLEVEGRVLLILATLGTLIVMWLWVRAHTYELGLRRAVGARRRAIFGFVLLRAAIVAAAGVVIGCWLGLFVWGTIATVIPGVPAWDGQAALRIAPLLVAAAFVGAVWPAWQVAVATPAELVRGGLG